jgi:hypothetical protein
VGGLMAEIITSNGVVILVDEDDLERLSKFRWFTYKGKTNRTAYAARSDYTTGSRRQISMHRYILGASTHEEVDHINGDGLDNRKQNLRVCSTKENNRNKPRPKNNTTGYKGVSYHARDLVYCAYIRVDRKLKHLGSFKTAEDAALAYNKAALKYFGDFARLNQIGIILS